MGGAILYVNQGLQLLNLLLQAGLVVGPFLGQFSANVGDMLKNKRAPSTAEWDLLDQTEAAANAALNAAGGLGPQASS